MSKIFKISGNFTQKGEWIKPDPSFTGKIVVDDANAFYGYCNEIYDSHMPKVNKTRFLVGAFAPNGKDGKLGIAFYKISNDLDQAPLMYVVPDLDDTENGSWAVLYPFIIFAHFTQQGKAKITVEEVIYSKDKANRIKSRFEKLDRSIPYADQLLSQEQQQRCIDALTNAK